MNSSAVWEEVSALQRAGIDSVVITLTAVRGSTPGSLGGKAVVSAGGLVAGNLGGGRVEAKAIATAQAMLEKGQEELLSQRWHLQRDVGMTCGGAMEFLFEPVRAHSTWHLLLFGAGHVSQALAQVLATLPCQVEVIDVRDDWLEKLPAAANLTRRKVERFQDGVAFLQAHSYLLSITQGHATDRPVLREALRQFPDLPFVGVIGSASKRAVLLRELAEDGIAEETREAIVCPLGLPLGGNDPAEIAISISAQLLQRRGHQA
ncbi:MAG: xanthine dehydrogenase accessory protein XdhC [Verrucomicrobiota bacterium]